MENLAYLIPTVFFAVILIAAFVRRRRLSVMIKKMIYGQYSFRYLSSLPNNVLEMTHPPALRYDPWYEIQGLLNNKSAPKYQTSENIDFQKYEIGKSYPGFFKNAGDPFYLTISENKKDKINFVVVGYKQQIYKYDAVMLYFFWNEILVAGQYQIRREKQKVSPSDLAAKLMDKYVIKEGDINTSNFKIQDKNGIEVYFQDDGFALKVNIFRPELITQLQQTEPAKLSNKIGFESAAVATF